MGLTSFFSEKKQKKKQKKAKPIPSTQREREEQVAERLSRREARSDPNSKLNIAMPYIWGALAVFLGLCLYTPGGGFVGQLLRFLFLSFFSYAAYIMPIALFITALTWRKAIAERTLLRRTLLFLFSLFLVLALLYVLSLPKEALFGEISKSEVPLEGGSYFSYSHPVALRGGFIGALVGWVLYRLVGPVLTIILAALSVLLYGIFGFGFSPDAIFRSFFRFLKEKRLNHKSREEASTDGNSYESALGFVAEAEPKGEGNGTSPSEPLGETISHEETERRRRFDDIFAETRGAHESEAADAAVSEQSLRERDENHASYKEQKIRERLRKHDGVHTYAVSDLCATSITEPQQAPLNAGGTVGGGVTHMSAEVLSQATAAPEVGEADTAFRGVEDFRRITVTEPVRVHSAPSSTLQASAYREEGAIGTVASPLSSAEAPAAPTALSRIYAPTGAAEERAVIREAGREVDRAGSYSTEPREVKKTSSAAYEYPSLSLLRIPALNEENDQEEIQKNADTLVRTLESFGIPITITGYTRGPRITRYEFVQKAGIRVAKVASYADDITQKLSTQGVRIEAPIPNKSSIGVEVPNRKSPPVRIRSLLDTDTFRDAESKTTVAVGCDVTGTPVFFDIAKAPHMLIAGATGMGKSVCINSLLISLLYKASPEEVRLILIDPKKVEFNVYSKIPHLLIPVVTDPNKAAGALNWAVNEMEKRYDMIESASVRDIKGYNAYCVANGMEPLPKIVIVIDELNDLMMSARKIVEASICRIAQKARAAGIHLIIGTQRPSVNVITGDIKVNIPARIAFRVNQQVDSRTILDMQGAEKLLPHGDMLFSPAGTPQRVQGAFVEDEEVKAVASFLAQHVGAAVFDDTILADIEKEAAKCAQKNGDDDEGEVGGNVLDGVLDDPKFEQALDIAFSTGSISTSLLQRTIGVGFGRGARFIDAMYKLGIVGEAKGGARPRELLISRAEYEARRNGAYDD